MPAEILNMIVARLDAVDKVSLKYTSSSFQTWISVKCQAFKGIRKSMHVNRLSRDTGSLPAAVTCPYCDVVRLRSLTHRSSSGSWALEPPTYHEQLQPCCDAPKPWSGPRKQVSNHGDGTGMNDVSIRKINVQKPDMALFLICLHCSTEVPLWDDELASGRLMCPECQCPTCPTVFMPRKIGVTLLGAEATGVGSQHGVRLYVG